MILCPTHEDLKTIRGIVYLFINLINSKVYVGITRNTFFERYRIGPNSWHRLAPCYLKNALLKYGANNFHICLLEMNKTIEELNELEVEYIQFFKSDQKEYGYNIHPGGRLRYFSEQTRIKLRNSHTRNKQYTFSLWHSKYR